MSGASFCIDTGALWPPSRFVTSDIRTVEILIPIIGGVVLLEFRAADEPAENCLSFAIHHGDAPHLTVPQKQKRLQWNIERPDGQLASALTFGIPGVSGGQTGGCLICPTRGKIALSERDIRNLQPNPVSGANRV
ncbi:hypothetical protein CEXT_732791 [Caerostris extrusa]|uniref:Uncharacterized protein n=1 Tax=Caerostris extrusa TaxID=172846 RepID=A0AAV4R1P0_CAEEX|nr:hypothetical protein CEXT_732791 [Caerostris extrusa]